MIGEDHLWYLRQIVQEDVRDALVAAASQVEDVKDSLSVFRAIRDYTIEHGSKKEGKQTNETDEDLEARLLQVKEQMIGWVAQSKARQAQAKVLIVTHSNMVKGLLVKDLKANKRAPKKTRVHCLNSELFPYKFRAYDDDFSDMVCTDLQQRMAAMTVNPEDQNAPK